MLSRNMKNKCSFESQNTQMHAPFIGISFLVIVESFKMHSSGFFKNVFTLNNH